MLAQTSNIKEIRQLLAIKQQGNYVLDFYGQEDSVTYWTSQPCYRVILST